MIQTIQRQDAALAQERDLGDVLQYLSQSIASIRYGAIEITVYEGRITQIEKREKLRLQASGVEKNEKIIC